MAKRTLLEIVQEITDELDLSEVTSITDTAESEQIAEIVRSSYQGMLADREVPEHKELFQLTETDANSPSVMQIPSNVLRVDWVEMDVRTSEAAGTPKDYEEIEWKEPPDFIRWIGERNDQDSNVETLNDATYTGSTDLFIYNDRSPSCFTSFDDENMVFDAYDSNLDTFIPGSKTRCYGVLEPTWTNSDGFTPDLDADQFPLLISISKNRCWAALKQSQNPKEERWERRLWVVNQFNTHRAKHLKRRTDFGRRQPRYNYSPLSKHRI